jgi:hypothetical protein
MSFFVKALVFLVVSGLLPVTGYAQQATFTNEWWKPNTSSATVDIAIGKTTGTPAVTFTSTNVDYPMGAVNNQSSNLPLSNFLGSDAAGATGNTTQNVQNSVFRFSGFIELTSGPHVFTVGSDDGYRLNINGNMVSQQVTPRGFRDTTVTATIGEGVFPFELYFYENSGSTGVEFFIDGVLAVPAPKANITSLKDVKIHREDGIDCDLIPGTPDATASAFVPGSCIQYDILISNSGPGASRMTDVIDEISTDMIFINANSGGFDNSATTFSFDTPPSLTDCGTTICIIKVNDAIIPSGGTGTITVRTILK